MIQMLLFSKAKKVTKKCFYGGNAAFITVNGW
jgi:hypothetical protein